MCKKHVNSVKSKTEELKKGATKKCNKNLVIHSAVESFGIIKINSTHGINWF